MEFKHRYPVRMQILKGFTIFISSSTSNTCIWLAKTSNPYFSMLKKQKKNIDWILPVRKVGLFKDVQKMSRCLWKPVGIWPVYLRLVVVVVVVEFTQKAVKKRKAYILFNKKWHYCYYKSLALGLGLLGWAVLLQHRRLRPRTPDIWSVVVAAFQFLRSMRIWFSRTQSTKPSRGSRGEPRALPAPLPLLARLPARQGGDARLQLGTKTKLWSCSHLLSACMRNEYVPSAVFSYCLISGGFMVGCPSAILIPLVRRKKKKTTKRLNWELISFNISC